MSNRPRSIKEIQDDIHDAIQQDKHETKYSNINFQRAAYASRTFEFVPGIPEPTWDPQAGQWDIMNPITRPIPEPPQRRTLR